MMISPVSTFHPVNHDSIPTRKPQNSDIPNGEPWKKLRYSQENLTHVDIPNGKPETWWQSQRSNRKKLRFPLKNQNCGDIPNGEPKTLSHADSISKKHDQFLVENQENDSIPNGETTVWWFSHWKTRDTMMFPMKNQYSWWRTENTSTRWMAIQKYDQFLVENEIQYSQWRTKSMSSYPLENQKHDSIPNGEPENIIGWQSYWRIKEEPKTLPHAEWLSQNMISS